jgi:hypothetical protein
MGICWKARRGGAGMTARIGTIMKKLFIVPDRGREPSDPELPSLLVGPFSVLLRLDPAGRNVLEANFSDHGMCSIVHHR